MSSQHTSRGGGNKSAIKTTHDILHNNDKHFDIKSDDPIITNKIKQVLEVVQDRNVDEITLSLHQNDYDVAKTIDFLFEGGKPSEDWITAGIQRKKTVENETERQQVVNKKQGNNKKKPNPAKTPVTRTEKKDSPEKINLEEKIANVTLNEQKDNDERNGNTRVVERRNNDIRRNKSSGNTRNGGNFNKTNSNRGPRQNNENRKSYPNNNNNNVGPVVGSENNEFISSNIDSSIKTLAGVVAQGNTEERISLNGDNLKHIGTWSNEHNDKKQTGAKRNNNFNRFNNSKGHVNEDDWENDEEWQGDLTQTQIFTASSQIRKDEAQPTTANANFPIGHFNAEEAAQKIKKAVGIGAPDSNKPQNKNNTPVSKIIASVKPPPPSTKIPKSAVVMPDGTTSSTASFNLDVQFGIDFDPSTLNQKKTTDKPKTPNNSNIIPPVSLPKDKQLNNTTPINNSNKQEPSNPTFVINSQNKVEPPKINNFEKKLDTVSKSQNYQSSSQPPLNIAAKIQQNSQQNPQRSFPINNTQQKQENNLLNNISPQNGPPNPKNNNIGLMNNQLNQLTPPNANNNTTNKPNIIPPPPGVNVVNPNPNQYLIGFPFNQNFQYYDQSQIDSASLMQMYNQLAGLPVPPGVANSAAPTAPQYPLSDTSKFQTNDTNSNSQLNLNPTSQLTQQQQQQPINLIPNLNNFPFFFPNYPYPNLYMPIPNGSQANQQQQFQNKPTYNFNANYDEQNKDYNYNSASQIKTSSSNLSTASNNMGNTASVYQNKNVDKNNSGGYHASTPPNFSNSLLNPPPPQQQFAYMISAPGNNMVHGMQDNLNGRNIGNNNTNNLKSMPKSNHNYPNNSWQ